MNDWFRSWHGAPTDPKWLVIGKRAGVAPGIVSAIVWALLDHASQADDRGLVGDFDFETYAAVSGFDEEMVRAVYAALEAKAVIISGHLAKWEKRQPRREDVSAERVRNHRRRAETEPSLPLDGTTQFGAEKGSSAVAVSATHEPSGASPRDDAATPSAPDKVLISPQAHDLAGQVTALAGHDLQFVPPSWCGAAYRAQVWLDQGWRVPLILESVRAQMAHKRDGPPGSIQYFEKGILRAHAEAGSPLPSLQIIERQGEVIHVAARNRQGSSGLAAADRLLDRLGATSAAQGE